MRLRTRPPLLTYFFNDASLRASFRLSFMLQ